MTLKTIARIGQISLTIATDVKGLKSCSRNFQLNPQKKKIVPMRSTVCASFCMILAALASLTEAQHNESVIAPTVAANSINRTIEFGESSQALQLLSQGNVVLFLLYVKP